jgi:hypothetical protein
MYLTPLNRDGIAIVHLLGGCGGYIFGTGNRLAPIRRQITFSFVCHFFFPTVQPVPVVRTQINWALAF